MIDNLSEKQTRTNWSWEDQSWTNLKKKINLWIICLWKNFL